MSCPFCSVQYCQKVFVTTCVLKKTTKKRGFGVFTSSFNRTVVAQKLFRRTDTFFSQGGFEMDKSSKLQMIRLLPCWRQHLTLHMKTALFHCLWVTYTFHSIIGCNKNILVQKDESFLGFNKPTGPDRDRRREVVVVWREGGGEEKRVCMRTRPYCARQ